MIIQVNGRELDVEEKDEINVIQEPCDICGKHTDIYHERNGEIIWKEVSPY